MSKATNKPLRFAVLIRVSTEKQVKRGESLRTQEEQITAAVAALGGKIAIKYAGQEHATAGWERAQLKQLLADAERESRPFDAVMVADASRWSRDNVASDLGLEALLTAGVRFFVLGTEYDLANPESRMFLRMTATIGAYHAATQKKKSLDNRLSRAQRGLPALGRLPFGRTWDAKSETWGIDPDKQAIVVEAARRYLAGESLPALAKRFGMNHSNLAKVLRERTGPEWKVRFGKEYVTFTVPPLLDAATARKVRERLEANRTHLHGAPTKHKFLLLGRIFCAKCGHSMMGQVNRYGKHYYRHTNKTLKKPCPLRPRPWVPAELIEPVVIRELFGTFGNPAAIERAAKAAIPDCDRLLIQQEKLRGALAKLDKGRDRILKLVSDDLISDAQSAKQLRELNEREAGIRAELDKLDCALAAVPDPEGVRLFVEQWGPNPGDVSIMDAQGNLCEGGNDVATGMRLLRSPEDQKRLLAAALDGMVADADGKLRPAGVYIAPAGEQTYRHGRYKYEIRGNLVHSEGVTKPQRRAKAVAQNASHCRAGAPPARRSWPPGPRSSA